MRDEQRSVGVLVHHVGTMYPIEADVVRMLAENGEAPGVTGRRCTGSTPTTPRYQRGCGQIGRRGLVRGNVRAAVETCGVELAMRNWIGWRERTGLKPVDDAIQTHRESPDCPSV